MEKVLKWRRVFVAMEAKIRSGELQGKLPGYQKLSEEYGTSVITIGRVIHELERRGYVVIRPKSGVTVEPQLIDGRADRPREKCGVKTVALVLPTSIDDPYWAPLAHGALVACEQRNQMGRTKWRLQVNYGLPELACGLVKNKTPRPENLTPAERIRAEEQEKTSILDVAQEVDGLIIAPRVLFDADFYHALLRKGIRLVMLDNKLPGIPTVTSHNRRAAYQGIAFLLLGIESNAGRVLRRTGTAQGEAMAAHLKQRAPQIYVLTESTAQATTLGERITGCQDALRDAAARGYPLAPTWLRTLPPVKNLTANVDEAYRETKALIENLEAVGQLGQRGASTGQISTGETASIALFALTDRCALGAYRALKEKGYANWGGLKTTSVALLSYDNTWQNLQAYSISSLAQDPFRMGQSGAEMLFDLPHPSTFLESGDIPPDILLEVGLVQRDSTRLLPRLGQ